MKLALFDFDGTITSKDTYIDFIIYSNKSYKLFLGILRNIFYLAAYFLTIINNDGIKSITFKYFFRNWNYDHFNIIAAAYSRERLHKMIRNNALERIEWHKKNGDLVVIVTASIENCLKDWCRKMDIGLIGSHVEVIDGVLTGNFSMPNCYGKEKVNRIKKQIDLNMFDYVYAYGDSKGDIEMLELADEKFYEYF